MIRTADAAGFDQVILSEGCVDVYQSKVQRALQGSQFHVSIVTNVALDKWIVQAKMRHILTVATALDDTAMSFKELKLTESIAIIMGNEGQGVSQEVLSQVDKSVHSNERTSRVVKCRSCCWDCYVSLLNYYKFIKVMFLICF